MVYQKAPFVARRSARHWAIQLVIGGRIVM